MISSPAVAHFDEAALRWLKDLFGLPAESAGAFVLGDTSANFTCLAAARHAVLARAGWNVEEEGLRGSPEVSVIVGEEAHSVIFKILPLLGFGRAQLKRVPVDDQGRMRADKLPAIAGPTIVCIQAGNVNSGAFDPAPQIIQWAHDEALRGSEVRDVDHARNLALRRLLMRIRGSREILRDVSQ